MRIACPECGGKTAIADRVVLSARQVEIYGQCRNVRECGGTGIHALTVQRLLQPPALEVPPPALDSLALGGRVLICPCCGGKAGIESRQVQTPQVADLYCRCQGPCGARFVATLAFSRWAHPPVRSVADLAAGIIRGLPAGERARIGQMELFA